MRVSPLVFDRELSRFKAQIKSNSNGQDFTTFHQGLAATWEGYKERVRDEAINRLKRSSWKKADIGTGKILQRVINAIEINEHPQFLRNNLVAWPNRYGHANRAHSTLLDAQTDATVRRKFEQWFFDFAKEALPDGELFESFRKLAGNRYDLVAYLFFLKDWTQYMPIATTTFDTAFRFLEIDLVTKMRCSWENYQRFNDALRAVQRRLIDVGEVSDARLIDAHSFCWILARLETMRPRIVTIPLPESLSVAGPAPITKRTMDVRTEFNELNDEWFTLRDANRRRLGKLAQEIALLSERARLRHDRHSDAEGAVHAVWTQPGRGYDILSQGPDQMPRYIEVKAARRIAGTVSFFLSANEWNAAQTLHNYWFYLVFNADSKQPKVQMLRGSEVSKKCITPLNYVAAMTIQHL